MADRDRLSLTVVVPVRNDRDRLAACLEALRAEGIPASHILVIDHDSRDGSGEAAAARGITVLRSTARSVAQLRNDGVRHVASEWIAFVDADHLVQPGWLDALRPWLDDALTGALGAPYLSPPRPTWVQAAYGCLRRHPAIGGDIEWLGAGNLVVRREAFLAIAGFDETLVACEDVDLCFRLRRTGWRVVAEPGLRSVHTGDPASLRAVVAGERWRGRDNLRVSFRTAHSPRSLVTAVLPMLQLLAVALVVTAVLPVMPAPIVRPVILGAFAVLAASLALRVIVMAANAPVLSLRLLAGITAVAVAFDTGRALALVTRANHHRRVPEAASASA